MWGVGVAHLGSAYTRPAHTLSPDLRVRHFGVRGREEQRAKSKERRGVPGTVGVEVVEVEGWRMGRLVVGCCWVLGAGCWLL